MAKTASSAPVKGSVPLRWVVVVAGHTCLRGGEVLVLTAAATAAVGGEGGVFVVVVPATAAVDV